MWSPKWVRKKEKKHGNISEVNILSMLLQKLLFLCVCGVCVRVCMSVHVDACGDQKSLSDHLEIKFYVVTSLPIERCEQSSGNSIPFIH